MTCDKCKKELAEFATHRKYAYERADTRMELIRQTPREVIEQYHAEGYNLTEAIKSEMSYL